jgi:hypothetical protein
MLLSPSFGRKTISKGPCFGKGFFLLIALICKEGNLYGSLFRG